MLVLSHDVFFGDLQLTRVVDGITLSHRIANSPPADVPTHTHSDAHFVLITSGDYVSSARRDANPRTKLIYNPLGTTHLEARASMWTRSSVADGVCAMEFELATQAESLCVELLAEASDTPTSASRLPPQWLRTACEVLQDCPGETPRIRDVAQTVGVHTAHLARAFRTFLGCTPGDLLRARRLQLAAAALMNSDRSLAEIALDSGFSDQAQFTKAFRRAYGVPPGAYRQLSANFRRSRDVVF